MKDYRIKEAIDQNKQILQAMRARLDELTEKYDVLIEILTEKEQDDAKEAEKAETSEVLKV